MSIINKILENLGDRFIEYCIFGGIVALVISLLYSIFSCFSMIREKEKFNEKAEKLDNLLNDSPKQKGSFDIKETLNLMQVELKKRKRSQVDLVRKEDELEKTSIINYNELKEISAKEDIFDCEILELDSDDDFDYVSSLDMTMNIGKQMLTSTPKGSFRPSEFISPIHGISKNENVLKSITVDNNAKMVSKEIKSTKTNNNDVKIAEELLTNLRELRKSLD